MLLNRKKSRSFSGSLPTIHLQPDEDFGGDDSMDGGGVRRVSAPVTWLKRMVSCNDPPVPPPHPRSRLPLSCSFSGHLFSAYAEVSDEKKV